MDTTNTNDAVLQQNLTFDKFRTEVLKDYQVACESRETSLLGRKEVLTGKAKFGIFGDGKEVAQLAHRCVGPSANCGMNSILPPLRALEAMGRAGQLAGADVAIASANAEFRRIRTFFTERFN